MFRIFSALVLSLFLAFPAMAQRPRPQTQTRTQQPHRPPRAWAVRQPGVISSAYYSSPWAATAVMQARINQLRVLYFLHSNVYGNNYGLAVVLTPRFW